MNQSANQLIIEFISKIGVNQLINPSVSQNANQLINRWISQTMNQSLK